MPAPTPHPPTARAHRIASLVFGIAGMILLIVYAFARSWQFAWLLLGLGILACVRCIWHAIRSRLIPDDR